MSAGIWKALKRKAKDSSQFKQGDRVSVVQGRWHGAFGILTVVGETLSLLQRHDAAAKGTIPVFNVNLAKLDEDRAKVNDGSLDFEVKQFCTYNEWKAWLLQVWPKARVKPLSYGTAGAFITRRNGSVENVGDYEETMKRGYRKSGKLARTRDAKTYEAYCPLCAEVCQATELPSGKVRLKCPVHGVCDWTTTRPVKVQAQDGLLMNAALAALLIKLWEYATRRDDKTRYADYPGSEARRTLPNA